MPFSDPAAPHGSPPEARKKGEKDRVVVPAPSAMAHISVTGVQTGRAHAEVPTSKRSPGKSTKS
jgi:hypothetical protein